MNGDPSLKQATRLRVERAANELGYRVDLRTAGLRSGKTNTLAVVVIVRAGQSATHINPFHYSLLGNVCTAAAARGYHAPVSVQSDSGDFYSDYMEMRQVDDVILLGTSPNDMARDYHRPLLERDNVACWGSPFDAPGRSCQSDANRSPFCGVRPSPTFFRP
ncbi:LacI family DNA-binding transcriptional regulator [Croceicoccus sp. YJ47]|nr:LacI family DNA-binding transcriptional regulator [Croceicoccus sp. YJ47]